MKLTRFYAFLLMGVLSIGTLQAELHPQAGQWQVSADYLYLLPSVDNTYFVLEGNSDPNPDFPSGAMQNNDFDFQPGFRVGAAYGFCNCERDIRAEYTRLSAKQQRKVFGTNLWAGTGIPGIFGNLFRNYQGYASSDLHNLYERAEAIVSQKIWNCCALNLWIEGGLEYAFINLHEKFEFSRGSQYATINKKSRTWGIGPEFGFSGQYELCSFEDCTCPGKIVMTARSSGSLLASSTNSSEIDQHNDFIFNVGDQSSWRLVPALHANVGLNYTLGWGCYDLALEIGYEFNSYLRALNRPQYVDDFFQALASYHYDNYDTQGLYISASFDF